MPLKRLLATLLSTAFLVGIGSLGLAAPEQGKQPTGKAATALRSGADTTAQGKNLRKIMMESYKRSHPARKVSKAASDMEAQKKSLHKIMMESYQRSHPTSTPQTAAAKRKKKTPPQESGRQPHP